MSVNDTLKAFEAIFNHSREETAIKHAMSEILNQSEVEEDEIPQNSNLGAAIRVLIKNEKDVFSAIQKIDLDYMEIGEYRCFKADDETSGTESIYFISPAKILYIEE